jgi:hypothetical protein
MLPDAARSLDDLVDPLVAEAQRLGDLAQRAAGELQPAHRVVEARPGDRQARGVVSCLARWFPDNLLVGRMPRTAGGQCDRGTR